MGTSGPKSLDELGRRVAAHEDARAAMGEQQSITAMLLVLRDLGSEQVAPVLWPGCLVLLDADAVKDVVTRYTVLDQSIARVTADTGCSEALIRVVLEHSGIPVRRPGHLHTWTAAEIDELKRRHRADEPIEQVAAGLNLPLKTVCRKRDQLRQLGLLSS